MLENPDGCWRLTAQDDDAGSRLDVFLANRFGCSRTAVHRRLHGPVTGTDGQRLKWARRLSKGETVLVKRLRRPEPQVEVRYRILACDEWLVAVDKGPGAPVHPTRSFRTRTILTHLRSALGDPGLSPAHRIDRETSGVLVFGRHTAAVAGMARQFAAGQVAKEYLAVVHGRPAFDRLTLEAPLERDPLFPVQCRMRVAQRAGQAARTELAVLARAVDRALVRARPRTGRMHQIRVHLAAAGHPILGDKLYLEDGRPYLALIAGELTETCLARLGHSRLALHAWRLAFDHPGSGLRTRLTAPLPGDLRTLMGPGLAVDSTGGAP